MGNALETKDDFRDSLSGRVAITPEDMVRILKRAMQGSPDIHMQMACVNEFLEVPITYNELIGIVHRSRYCK